MKTGLSNDGASDRTRERPEDHRTYAYALFDGSLETDSDNPAETIQRYTAMARRAAAADRAFVYLTSRKSGLFELFIEELGPGVESRNQGFVDGAEEGRREFEAFLKAERFLQVTDRSALRDFDPVGYQQLGRMLVESVVIAAVRVRGDVLGFVGFDSCSEPHEWTDDEKLMLQMLADVVGDYIHRGGDQITLTTDRELLDQMQRMSRQCAFVAGPDGDFDWFGDPRELFERRAPTSIENLTSILDEDSGARFEHAWRMASSQGIPFGMDVATRSATSDGIRHLHVRGKAKRREDGRNEIQGAFQDISARVQQERMLRRTFARHRLVFSNARDAIVIGDAQTNTILEVNRAAEVLWNTSAAKLVGQGFEVLHPPERLATERENFGRVLGGHDSAFETLIQTADGSRLPVEIRATRLEWTEGQDAILAFFRDIRDRERARRVMRMRVQILRSIATDASLQTVAKECAELIEATHDGVVVQIRLGDASHKPAPQETGAWVTTHSSSHGPTRSSLTAARRARIPLCSKSGEAVGDVLVYLVESLTLAETQGVIDEAVQLMQVALERVSTLEELTIRAQRDELTQQYNRAHVAEYLIRTLPSPDEERGVCALVIDVDDFKKINDTLGHAAGDKVIQTIAHRLAAQIPEGAVFGRWGGDEFVVVLPDELLDRAEEIAELCLREVEAAIRFEVATIFVTLSIGIAFRHFGETSWEPMLQRADTAMYRAKKAGRNRFRVYDEMRETAPKTSFRSLHRTLEGLLEDGKLDLLVRPRRMLEGSRFRGARVLGAWRRKDDETLIDPQRVLPDPTQRARFDRAVLEATLEQIAQSPDDEAARLTIQLGAQSFTDLGRLDTILSAIGNIRSAAGQLELSIEALALGDDFEQGARHCDRIRNSLPDIRLAVHRVGAGNTPLAGLLHLPVNIFELDEGLIETLPADPIGPELAVIRAYGTLARIANRTLRAPSIDRSHLIGLLAESGVREGYGSVIGDPIPWEEFVREASM